MPPIAPFWHEVRVPFDHTDAQGRVFYSRYFYLLDQARCAFWESLGLSEEAVKQIEHDTVIVHMEADYHGPAAFYDRLRILVQVVKLGRSSLHLLYRVTHAQHNQDVLTARMVMVHVDLSTEKSRPWSAAFRQAVSAADDISEQPAGGSTIPYA